MALDLTGLPRSQAEAVCFARMIEGFEDFQAANADSSVDAALDKVIEGLQAMHDKSVAEGSGD